MKRHSRASENVLTVQMVTRSTMMWCCDDDPSDWMHTDGNIGVSSSLFNSYHKAEH